MRAAEKLTPSTFDVLGLEETSSSLVRNTDNVRISFLNEEGKLEQFIKNDVSTTDIGSLLVSRDKYLLPTGDRRPSTKTVAKLLAPMAEAIQVKQVTIDGTVYTARLLPVQVL